jgi:hypothetical protein
MLSAKLTDKQTRELAANADAWFHQRPVSLDFVRIDTKDSKGHPASRRAIDERGMHAGRLLPRPPA